MHLEDARCSAPRCTFYNPSELATTCYGLRAGPKVHVLHGQDPVSKLALLAQSVKHCLPAAHPLLTRCIAAALSHIRHQLV